MLTGIVAAVGRIESRRPLGAPDDADACVRLTVHAGGLHLPATALGHRIAIERMICASQGLHRDRCDGRGPAVVRWRPAAHADTWPDGQRRARAGASR